MKKSKSWLKSLLIVAMAIILVFSLVACNKGKGDDNGPPVEESSADYFNALWSATKPIGAKTINADDDLSVSLGLEVCVDTIDSSAKGTPVYQKIDLGLDVQLVLGRKATSADKTAAKIRLYDPSDANHTEILTLYAFANDLDNLYLDFADKNVKLPHNLETLIWKEELGNEGTAGAGLTDFLTTYKVSIGGAEKTINEIITMFTSKFGDNWSLNSLVDSVLTLINMSPSDLIDFLEEEKFAEAICSVLQINSLDELLDNGNLNVLKIITSDTIGQFFTATKQKVNGAYVHKANLNQILDFVLLMTGDTGTELKNLIYHNGNSANGGEVSLLFTEKNGAIQDFSIYAQLAGFERTITDANGETHLLLPELSVKITELSIDALKSDNSNGVALKTGKNNYSDTVAFDETIELEASGITILGETENDHTSLNGKIIINAKGQVDLVNTKAVIADTTNSITENKTKANITVKLGKGTAAPTDLITISYANGKIAGKVVNGKDLSILGDEYKNKVGFYYDLGDFNIADIVQNAVRSLVESLGGGSGEASANEVAAPNRTLVEKITGAIEVALGMVTTPDNHLNIVTNDILKTVIAFKEAIVPGSSTDKWTVSNRVNAIANTFLNTLTSVNDVNDCFTTIEEAIDNYVNDDTDTVTLKDTLNACKDPLIRIVYLFAQAVRIDGVTTTNLNASNYTGIAKDDSSTLTQDEMIFIENLKAVLAAKIEIDGDLQGGINASVNVNIKNATLSVSSKFTLVDSATYVDVYEQYTAANDTEKAKWVDIADLLVQE
ncbi:MAG: hypothetical protein NC037_02595 [Bacteroides sp.]|nr:hypothetical protein [Bacillota bacterium]MCM1393416.1 hypothetical protein [[Eubacterium] siraeum]MCM1455402.1 hypothetical protein [Bacteroides sp.]